jgi:methylamine dehydrogenase accessory protein MauD
VDVALLLARLLLAVVFALSGVAKLADRAGFRQVTIDFGVPSRLATPLGIFVPLAELAVAAALIPTVTAWWGALGALALLLLFTAGIGANLVYGRKPECRCFGRLHSAPVGWKTLARNGLLLALAAFVAWSGTEKAGASAVSWMGALSTAQLLGLIFGLVVLVLFGIQGGFLLHLLRQNARLLVRLQTLEEGHDVARPGNRSLLGVGLPVGSAAPAFSLQNLLGAEVTLDNLLAAGKPVVLTFTSPECDYCTELLPEIARWQHEHSDKLTISLVSELSIEENRAHLADHSVQHVLVQEDWEVGEDYRVEVTPSAILITSDGAVGSPLAEGSDAVETLVAQAVGDRAQLPMLHSIIAHTAQETIPTGPEVGEPAPE